MGRTMTETHIVPTAPLDSQKTRATGSKIRPGHRTSLPPKLLDTTGLPSRAEGDSSLARLTLTLWVSYSAVVSEGDLLLHHTRYRRHLAASQVWASRANPLPFILRIH